MVVFVEDAFPIHVIAAEAAVVADLPAGGIGFCQTAAALIHMPCTADPALIGFLLNTVFCVDNVPIIVPPLVGDLAAGRAFFVVFRRSYLPLIIQRMTLGTGFFLFDVIANHALDAADTGLRTGSRVASLYFLPVVGFRRTTFAAGMLVGCIFFREAPQMHFRITDLLHTVIAEPDMGSVTKIRKLYIGMDAVFHNTAAAANIRLRTVLICNRFHPVVDPNAAIDRSCAVANSAAVTGRTAAHIPAVSQGITDDQHIAVAQIHAGHRLTGVVGRSAYAVHPAGTAGVIKFTEAVAGAGTLVQTVSVQAAPKGSKSCSRAKAGIDGGEHLCFCGTGPASALQGIGIVSGGKALQIESAVQCTDISAAPAQCVGSGTKGFSGVLTHNSLGDHIGYRFVGQHIVAQVCHNTQTKGGHIHINGGCAHLLTGFSALSGQGQRQLAVVTQRIFRVDMQDVGVGIARFGIDRI